MVMHTAKSPAVRLRHDLDLRLIESEGAFLASERGVNLLEGELAVSVMSRIDGTRTVDEIVSELSDHYSVERIRNALDRLIATGTAVLQPERDRDGLASDAGFYEMAGVEVSTAAHLLRTARVAIYCTGEVESSQVVEYLRASGVGSVAPVRNPEEFRGATLAVALTDDYLRHDLARINTAALSSGTAWMLARPVGSVVWVGPLFRPYVTGCWSCLADRVAANRQLIVYLQNRLGDEAIGMSTVRHRVASAVGAGVVSLEVLKAITGAQSAEGNVFTIDLLTTGSERHHFTRRPQCPVCGDPTIVAARGRRPVKFSYHTEAPASAGVQPANRPETIVEKLSQHISPITGVVTFLERLPLPAESLYVFSAGQNMSRQPGDLRALQWSLRAYSCGKGVNEIEARASALGEAIERFSAVFQGDEMRMHGTLDELGDAAIHPNACMLFSERQYTHRELWNLGASQFSRVFEPFTDGDPIDWSPVWSVTGQRTRWLPTQYLYYGYPLGRDKLVAQADSNGCASGITLEAATLSGLYELVERDSAALWWYNRVQRPGVDLDSFGDPYIDRLREAYAGFGREVWALDLTADLGIPAVGAFSRITNAAQEDILIAFAAHLEPRVAVLRAVTEMNQYLPAVLPTADGSAPTYLHDAAFSTWCRTATLANRPYLHPNPEMQPSAASRWPAQASGDVGVDLAYCQGLIESRGLELIVLDQTRPDVGLAVAKVIVPGLRHFWPRFAAGRLFDVPVALGWCAQETPERDLNPVPICI